MQGGSILIDAVCFCPGLDVSAAAAAAAASVASMAFRIIGVFP